MDKHSGFSVRFGGIGARNSQSNDNTLKVFDLNLLMSYFQPNGLSMDFFEKFWIGF